MQWSVYYYIRSSPTPSNQDAVNAKSSSFDKLPQNYRLVYDPELDQSAIKGAHPIRRYENEVVRSLAPSNSSKKKGRLTLFCCRHQAHLEIHVQVFLAMAKRRQEVVENTGAN